MSSFASRAQLLAGGIAAAFTIVSAAPQIASPPDFSSNFTSWVHKQSRTNRRFRYKASASPVDRAPDKRFCRGQLSL